MIVSKIKFRADLPEMLIEYLDPAKECFVSLTSRQVPHPDFVSCLDNLALFVNVATECDLDRITISGLTIKDSENGMGCTISFKYALLWTKNPMSMNTPFDALEKYPAIPHPDPLFEGHQLTLTEAVFDLKKHAEDFIKGKRAQSDLFEANADSPEEEVLALEANGERKQRYSDIMDEVFSPARLKELEDQLSTEETKVQITRSKAY